jgi:ribonuclease P protein component
MFRRENRLVPGARFNNSHLLIVPQFVLKEKENELSVNRFGVVVSKKIDKRAVARNKIKRFFRQMLSELNENINPGHDILLIVKKKILGATKEESMSNIGNFLGKAGLIKKYKS